MLVNRIVLLTALLVCCSFIATAKRGFNPHIDLRYHPLHRMSSSFDDVSSSSGSGYTYQWFTQQVDHFDQANTETFQQRYIVNDDFYVSGGPVFMIINGEGPMGLNTVSPQALQAAAWAQEFNALLVTLEHRYYGASFVTDDLSTDSLEYLSSQQALADNAVFRQFIAQEYSIPQGSKWVAFGGSYAGALTSWFRIKYPNLVDFVVASSGPVNAEIDFYQYLEVVQNSLETTANGQQCVANIAVATQKIQSMLTESNYGGVNDMFNLCPPLESDNDVSTFMQSLAGNFMGVVQYNDDGTNNPDINTLCATMTNEQNDPLTNYLEVWNQFAEGDCVDVSYESMIEELQNTTNDANTIGGRMWFYQTCTEFGYYQTSDSPNQPFGNLFGYEFNVQQCNDVFGFDFLPNVNWTHTDYGALNPVGTNVLYVNGKIDPWHALGIYQNPPIGQSELPSLFINGSSHCQDMMVPNIFTPSTLPPAQAQIQAWIQTQLNQ
ncbi:hypothetical protein DLAC_04602 [Tieghemostelium lacteum]|uniref:Peptidase S28 family protein n=1 Tax=Tieghemostelium lacteum TaxID=361077 RepID=A0A151ZJZ8_TIELA|nr:hypothetical protein DLAC_04602 [Tieghemostelium lacteum]|eukprot:KYQ94303.1 hypothetical protein DLAC_04602 [Tieghemostelium lacteum]